LPPNTGSPSGSPSRSKRGSQLSADCGTAGRLQPVIDRNRCEGKTECVKVCPYDVFEMITLDADQRRQLSPLGRLKAFFHRYRQATAAHPDQCHACSLCVSVCPEKAIRLVKAEPAPPAQGSSDSR
jgi:4Fe-4S ferredoxin